MNTDSSTMVEELSRPEPVGPKRASPTYRGMTPFHVEALHRRSTSYRWNSISIQPFIDEYGVFARKRHVITPLTLRISRSPGASTVATPDLADEPNSIKRRVNRVNYMPRSRRGSH